MMAAVRSALKVVAINVAVAIALIVFILAAAEVYLRATIPANSGGSLFESTLETRRYKVMKPNASITAWGSEVRTNQLGFRDSDSEVPAKSPSGYRVIVLGDSFTVSAGVDFDRTYPAQLESELNKRVPGTEVLNLAVGGYNLIQEELVLNEVGLTLQPDMVLVAAFPFNDLSNDDYRANFEGASGRAKPAQGSWYQDLYVYGAFLRRVENRIRGMFAASAGPATVPSAASTVAATDARENLDALDRIVRTARGRNIEVMVALLPNTDNLSAQKAEFAPFEAACEANGWPCLNLLDRFIDSGVDPNTLRLNLLDFHPNNEYNARIAALLVDDVAARIQAHKQGRPAQ